MDIKILIGLIFLAVINIYAFFLMLFDKNQSRQNKPRIGEGLMFFWASFFGGIGIYLGMFIFRHKTKKWYFIFGIPLIVFQNACFLVLLYQLVGGVCFGC